MRAVSGVFFLLWTIAASNFAPPWYTVTTAIRGIDQWVDSHSPIGGVDSG